MSSEYEHLSDEELLEKFNEENKKSNAVVATPSFCLTGAELHARSQSSESDIELKDGRRFVVEK